MVVLDDLDVLVPVRSVLLVPESDHMSKFVKEDAVLHAARVQSHLLCATSLSTHVRATPEEREGNGARLREYYR